MKRSWKDRAEDKNREKDTVYYLAEREELLEESRRGGRKFVLFFLLFVHLGLHSSSSS